MARRGHSCDLALTTHTLETPWPGAARPPSPAVQELPAPITAGQPITNGQIGGSRLRATFDLSDTDALQCTLVAARITDWALVLRLGRDALHYFLWTGERSFTSGLMNALARALAPCDPESAAVLQGATRRLVVGAERPSAGRAIAVDATAAMGPATGPVPFFIEIRRQATAIIREALGDDRMRALRAQGEAMDPDDALQYALAVVERNITPPDRESRFPDARIQP